jgi:hypothetical protein
MGIIQNPTLQTCFSRKRILSTPGFSDIDRFELIMKFFFTDNNNKESYDSSAKLHTIFPVL